MTTLDEIAAEKPYPDYAEWWSMGSRFTGFMAGAITAEWEGLGPAAIEQVEAAATAYIRTVYGREARSGLAGIFAGRERGTAIQSGEFDALSFAFFRSAFDRIAEAGGAYGLEPARARRRFTQRVGRRFFQSLSDHLALDLPKGIDSPGSFDRLSTEIDRVGAFLVGEGYLRDHFAFTFDVDIRYGGRSIRQTPAEAADRLKTGGSAWALYEMGFPVILPSAVYLYRLVGEAQHHSSRTIEDLFARVGFEARETDDFDPSGYPPGRVVELWEIAPQGKPREN